MVNYKKFIWPAILIIFIGIIILIRYNATKISTITLDQVDNKVKNDAISLVYVGEFNKDIETKMRQYKKDNGFKLYTLSNSIDEVNKKYNIEIQGDFAYLIYDKNGYLGFIDKTIEEQYYQQYFNKYLFNELPSIEIRYKRATADQYLKLVNSNEYTIAVLGDNTCTYCNMLENVINEIAINNKYDIYYLKKNDYTETDYNKILDLDFTIPARCTKKREETTLKAGYATPLTIVTKKGKMVDCILGYYEYNTYLEKLNKIMEG